MTKVKSARSQKDFPFLKLDDDEYVEFSFRRAKAYLISIYVGLVIGVALIALMFSVAFLSQANLDDMGKSFVNIILTALAFAAVFVAVVATALYRGNWLFITNKRVIQRIMESPVVSSMNMVDLKSIEDVSFSQRGILQTIFGFGTLRLSTVGDETTYTFKYVNVSADEVKKISDKITAEKNDKD